ncbi:MAG: HIT family protein [Bacteroidia bacterium]|nr:HIT family protein [Bacteroidia bacterium]MDA8628659.1 HIT family protein [Bacteroidia bacterium]MDA9213793.1 HIT family protein [Bacteroidia bacterium]MDG1747023.1 HIT family protein [Bacteroidia bacterium]
MTSIFSKIITGEIPCHRVHEDDKHLAFLDINPLAMGHVLCIPKVEVDYMYDMSEGSLADLWKFTIPVAKAIDKSMNCLRVGSAVIGLEVPHVHIHLIPLQSVEDINFSRPKLNPSKEELADIAQRIRDHI